MTATGEQLRAVLDGYANFLLGRELALSYLLPYQVLRPGRLSSPYVRWLNGVPTLIR